MTNCAVRRHCERESTRPAECNSCLHSIVSHGKPRSGNCWANPNSRSPERLHRSSVRSQRKTRQSSRSNRSWVRSFRCGVAETIGMSNAYAEKLQRMVVGVHAAQHSQAVSPLRMNRISIPSSGFGRRPPTGHRRERQRTWWARRMRERRERDNQGDYSDGLLVGAGRGDCAERGEV